MKDFYNSRRYHSFFEGYTEKTVVENGKEKIVRVYTGDYYRPKLTSGQRLFRKVLNCAFLALTMGLYVYCATQPLKINLSPLVGICQGFEGFLLLWLLVSVADYTAAKEQMTLRVYRMGARRLAALSLALAVLFGLMSLVYLLLTLLQDSWLEFFKLFPFSMACGISMFVTYYMEKRTEYERILSDEKPIKGGNEIKY